MVNDTHSLVFFDFYKAYDTVPRSKLIIKLEQMKTLYNIKKIVSNMLSNFMSKVGQEMIHNKTDLIQGSVLSPILFNIFLNDLLWTYEQKEITTRAYADDIVWIWSSIIQARESIDIMKNWWRENQMAINEKKSGILRILKRKGRAGIISNSLNIPEIAEYKYLRITINQSITTKIHSEIIKSKVLSLKRRLWLLKPSLVNLSSRFLIYETIILSQLSYACDSWYEQNTKGKDILKSALYQCLKWLLNIMGNVKKNIPFEALELTDRKSNTDDNEKLIIPFLSIPTIKLRVN